MPQNVSMSQTFSKFLDGQALYKEQKKKKKKLWKKIVDSEFRFGIWSDRSLFFQVRLQRSAYILLDLVGQKGLLYFLDYIITKRPLCGSVLLQ